MGDTADRVKELERQVQRGLVRLEASRERAEAQIDEALPLIGRLADADPEDVDGVRAELGEDRFNALVVMLAWFARADAGRRQVARLQQRVDELKGKQPEE